MINWKAPDYTEIFRQRQERLIRLRSDPRLVAAAKVHYTTHPWDFISDWGMTFDPRNLEEGRLANVPFILWGKQFEYLYWLHERWHAGERGLVEKSRDCGVTWLSVGYAVTNWLFVRGFAAGFGSSKEIKVDKKGDPDCIFEKIRHFLDNIPDIFLPEGFNRRQHSSFMKIENPEMESTVTGEAGDQIGRGGRKSIYFVDEAAFIEHQLAVDNSLSNTTNCQIDISTYNGSGNEFYRKAMKFSGTSQKFVFDWRDDPRKDDAWYAKKSRDLDARTVAQEIDRDPEASAIDSFIPAQWIRAAIDIHKRIKIPPTGIRVTAFDPADVGDKKATVSRYGYVINQAEDTDEGDITNAIAWAYGIADDSRADVLVYDGDGMGAPTMKTAFRDHSVGRTKIQAFHGSGGVENPDAYYGEERGLDKRDLKKNIDTFINCRAQAWTRARDRFENTYRLYRQIQQGQVAVGFNVEDIISIDSECQHYQELVAELSRPRREYTENGKIQVESKKKMKKREVQSPNLADSAVMCIWVTSLEPQKKQINSRRRKARDKGLGL